MTERKRRPPLRPEDASNDGVRLLRLATHRYSRDVIARQAGVPVGSIDQWITERRAPRPESRVLLEESFGIPCEAWTRPCAGASGNDRSRPVTKAPSESRSTRQS